MPAPQPPSPWPMPPTPAPSLAPMKTTGPWGTVIKGTTPLTDDPPTTSPAGTPERWRRGLRQASNKYERKI